MKIASDFSETTAVSSFSAFQFYANFHWPALLLTVRHNVSYILYYVSSFQTNYLIQYKITVLQLIILTEACHLQYIIK